MCVIRMLYEYKFEIHLMENFVKIDRTKEVNTSYKSTMDSYVQYACYQIEFLDKYLHRQLFSF